VKIVSIGELLWDVFENSETLGGAPFNFAVHAARLGHEVIFVSAIGDDERGRRARARVRELGLNGEFVRTVPRFATGVVSVRVDPSGQPDFTIHRPAAYDALRLQPDDLDRLAAFAPDWLCYGTLYQAEPASRAEVAKLRAALPRARRFYDVNLRRDSYTPELVAELLAASDALKLNEHEAAEIGALPESALYVAVTRGECGCAVRIRDDYAEVPGYPVKVADTVGAGDAFAAAFLHGISLGWTAAATGDFANRVGAVVASRPGGTPAWSPEDCARLRR
jgi:fructokinase